MSSTTENQDAINNNKKIEATKTKWRRSDLFGNSLVDQTVREMEHDADFQAVQARYAAQGAAAVTREERTRRRRALDALGIPSFADFLRRDQQGGVTELPLRRRAPTVLQLNIGLYCNQACGHCHVESSPLRTQESMTAATAARCLQLLVDTPSITNAGPDRRRPRTQSAVSLSGGDGAAVARQ